MPLVNRARCDDSILVTRAEARPHAGIWPIRLRRRLPVIPIPLLPDDPDARIDLQKILDYVYDPVGYLSREYVRESKFAKRTHLPDRQGTTRESESAKRTHLPD
jgi:Protein of unknown function (DUF4058)